MTDVQPTSTESGNTLGGVGAFFGEQGFGPVSQVVIGALEGLLFGACVVGAIAFARRRMERTP